MIKVSAIITTHNRLKLLRKAVESVKKQTFRNIEIIVVDDGSDDGTREYCMNEGVVYIYIPPSEHKNSNYARNIGIKKSTGKYIAFLDDDDEWLSDKIEKQVDFFEENPSYGLVSCLRKKIVNNKMILYDKLINIKDEEWKHNIFYTLAGTTSTYMVKKDALFNLSLFDENLEVWQDVEFVTNFAINSKIHIINEYLVIYRRNLNDKKRISNGKIQRWEKSVNYINEKYDRYIQELSETEKNKRLKFIYGDAAGRCVALNDKKNKKKYLYQVYKVDKSIKSFLKYIFNYTFDDVLLLKLRFSRGVKKFE